MSDISSLPDYINSLASPQLSVTIYPYESDEYIFDNQSTNIRSVSVTNSVAMGAGGAVINLTPGGPNGINTTPDWSSIITPMSLVVIALSRGTNKSIVFIGMVTHVISNSQRTNDGVVRGTALQCADFSIFFMNQSYYSLAFFTGAAGIEAQLGVSSDADFGQVQLPPDQMGALFYKKIMCHPKLLGSTNFQYNGSFGSIPDILATIFEQYNSNISIPFSMNFITEGVSWDEKFSQVFPWPFYERFIVTGVPSDYQSASFKGTANTDPDFSPNITGYYDANPTFVCRINPMPLLLASDNSENPTFSVNMDLWNGLQLFTLDGGWRANSLSYQQDEVKNFYSINPLNITQLLGGSGDDPTSFIYQYASFYNPASISRFGYRPQIQEINWFTDFDNTYAQSSSASGITKEDFETLSRALALKVVSQYEPTSITAKGYVNIALDPTITPGFRLRFAPYKDNINYDFYIESVTHDFEFGEASSTTLSLSRGLPSDVYADDGLMTAILSGNSVRVAGKIQSGLFTDFGVSLGNGITPLNINNSPNLSQNLLTPSNPPIS